MNPSTTPEAGCSPAQLEAYLRRIGHDGAVAPTEETLRALHCAQVGSIPFENLEIHLGRPMRIEPDALFEDLVHRNRGGYCFQLNELLALVLLSIGFRVERFAARVWFGSPHLVPPKAHQLLRVTTSDGATFLADTGFGGSTPLDPIPLELDRIAPQSIGDYMLVNHRFGTLLRYRYGDQDWEDLYSFTTEPLWPIDFKYANHAISTLPDSHFLHMRMAARAQPSLRQSLRDSTFAEIHNGHRTERLIAPQDLPALLHTTFNLDLPDDLPWLAQSDIDS